MTLEEIAQTITPTGYGAAIVGFVLSILVLSIRFRARNIAREAAAASSAADETQSDAPPVERAPPSQPKSLFKAFSPSDAKSPDAVDILKYPRDSNAL